MLVKKHLDKLWEELPELLVMKAGFPVEQAKQAAEDALVSDGSDETGLVTIYVYQTGSNARSFRLCFERGTDSYLFVEAQVITTSPHWKTVSK